MKTTELEHENKEINESGEPLSSAALCGCDSVQLREPKSFVDKILVLLSTPVALRFFQSTVFQTREVVCVHIFSGFPLCFCYFCCFRSPPAGEAHPR